MLHFSASSRRRRVASRFAFLSLAGGSLLTCDALSQAAPGLTQLPSVTVTAQKEAQPLQTTPASVTAATRSFLEDSGIRYVNDVALFAPNTHLSEFSARKLSNPRFRGVGASPNNPGVTTYIDGVPQLNANTSSLELVDVEQIELVRGPQGALFGRNTVGGLINITSIRPALDRVHGGIVAGFGDDGLRDYRVTFSAPLNPGQAAVSFAGGYSERDGYVTNPLTGHDLDWREAWFGKAQALLRLSRDWEARVIVSGERARDGDYRLNDLASIRTNPSIAPRNFEGFTHRDILAPTLQLTGKTGAVDITLTTGGVWWDTLDVTDLDYSANPLIERRNAEEGKQFTQEIRFSSPDGTNNALRWQAGVFLFTQKYDQDTFNFFPNPAFIGYPVGTPAFRSYTQGNLEDKGYGAFGQITFVPTPALALSLGLRADFEDKDAHLRTFTAPVGLGAVTNQNLSDDYNEFSPHLSASYQVAAEQLAYASVARGYKAGGFNTASPAGTERFDQEASWNYEAGYKASGLNNRLRANLAVFYSRWDDMQLNVPALTPGQFYTSNVGAASIKGVELEVTARPAPGLDVFGGAGKMSAKFRSGSTSNGVGVGSNRLPFSPEYTLNGGVQYSCTCLARGVTAFVRGEVTAFGSFFYNDQNTRSQGSYALTNFRLGLRARNWTLDGWVRNAFDEDYVMMAIPFDAAASGFIGEIGAPKTMGVSVGYRF